MNLKDIRVVVAGASVLSFVAGGASVYFITIKRIEKKYDEIAQTEIEEAKGYYSRLHKKGDFADLRQLANEYIETIDKAGYSSVEIDEVAVVEEVVDETSEEELEDEDVSTNENYRSAGTTTNNIFVSRTSSRPEQPSDDEEDPYVITHDEFYEGEKDYAQASLTYFEGEDLLVDETDRPIEDVDAVVGSDNLSRFGRGSKDPRVVHVRNDKLEVDYEIVLSKGNYAEEVLGFIEHSEPKGRPRKFRREYE